MIRVALLDDYQGVALTQADWSTHRDRMKVEAFDRHFASEDEAAAALQPFDVLGLMRERTPMPRSLIQRLPNLKLVVFTGGRTRSIDVAAAAERDILVCHTGSSVSSNATPELAWGLILSCARHIPDEAQRVRTGGWQQSLGVTLEGRTLGLLGLGRLGRRMVPIAKAFGMTCIAWSPNLTPERAAEADATFVSRAELFARADILSIHMVLAAGTRGLVGADDLGRMKRSAILINTSRGPIVQEEALVQAIRSNSIRAAGLDVFDTEPLPAEHALRMLPGVVATPHLGFVTEEAYGEYYSRMLEAIVAWLDGSPIRVLAAPAPA